MSSYNSFVVCKLSSCKYHILQLPAICCCKLCAPGDHHFTFSWQGSQDSGASQPDHRIRWNSKPFPIPSEIIKIVSRDLQKSPNELQRGAWNHRIHEKHEKEKSDENINIYNIFERLEHQKPLHVPLKSHQMSRQQSKSTSWHSKSQKHKKKFPNVSSMGVSKSIENQKHLTWDPPGLPWVHPCIHDHQNRPKVVSQDPQIIQNDVPRTPRGASIIRFECKSAWKHWSCIFDFHMFSIQ